MLLGLFTEYVQIPLINFLSETFRLPIHYSVEKTLDPCNTNIFNNIIDIIYNLDYNNQDDGDKNTESTEKSDDVSKTAESLDDAIKPTTDITEDFDENSSVPDLIEEDELLCLKKPNTIIIDETLD